MEKETLENAIGKAIDNGWKTHIDLWNYQAYPKETYIFNHDFAKALWGEYGYIPEAHYKFQYKKISGAEKTKILIVASAVSPWQYHLQQMVIADDPIKYLGENI